jgi:hypothetical protein|tara:strand:+ start:88 stop:1137 length:1050 start_codon:yes stop_codon:yes gene_type:complete
MDADQSSATSAVTSIDELKLELESLRTSLYRDGVFSAWTDPSGELRYFKLMEMSDLELSRITQEEKKFLYRKIASINLIQSQNLRRILFVKKCVLGELVENILFHLEKKQILSVLTCVRSVLEHVARVNSCLEQFRTIDVKKNVYFQSNLKMSQQKGLAVESIQKIVGKELSANRENIEKLLTSNIRSNSSLPFRNNPGSVDRKAEGLVSSVYRLGKKLKGVQRLYEIASEFIHPNAAVENLFETKSETADSGKMKNYTSYHYSVHVGDLYGTEEKIKDSLMVLIEVLEHFFECEIELCQIADKAKAQAAKFYKGYFRALQKSSGLEIVRRKDVCLCLSGRDYGHCCGG